jgi:hypothetical protein
MQAAHAGEHRPTARGPRREPPYHPSDGPYRGAAPRFHDPAEVPGLAELASSWREVREEAEAFLARRAPGLAPVFNPYGVDIPGWRSLNLETYLWRYHANRRALPRTVARLDRAPGLVSAFLNVLAPRAGIPPHRGESNTVWRCHLPLVVPGGVERCGIEVAGERRGWREGEPLVFCDAYEHRVWNDTDRVRVLLVFDVLKPAYRAQRLRVAGGVLAEIAVNLAETRRGRPLPRRLRGPLRSGLGLAAAALLPLQRVDWAAPLRRGTGRELVAGADAP